MADLTRQWLRQVVQPYPDQERVFADVDGALNAFPTLRPKTEVYTFNDGRTQLLICVHGLLPIAYRGSSYNIPVSFWVPIAYPKEPPMAYVVPTSDMFVRASKSVDPSGHCDVEYTQNWHRKSEGCDLATLVKALQDLFSREPPLYAKPKNQPVSTSSPAPIAPNPVPSTSFDSYAARPPPHIPGTQSMPVTTVSTPVQSPGPPGRPPVPAKPVSHAPSPSLTPSTLHPISGHTSYDARPPPPLPSNRPPHGPITSTVPTIPLAEPGIRPASAYGSISQSYTAPPGPGVQRPPQPHMLQHGPSRSVDLSAGGPPTSPPFYSGPGISPQDSGTGPAVPLQHPPPPPQWSPPPPTYSNRPASIHGSLQPHSYSHPPQPPPAPHLVPPPPPVLAAIPPPAAAPPIRNLLDDDGPDVSTLASSAPAPPRPPNPDIVRLHAAVHAKIHGELSALASAAASDSERLRATQEDLLAGEPAIRDEMARLEAVRDVCRTVAGRFREVVGHAEANVGELRRKGDPEVDELVCSTSIVHNQLINLVAEDNAIEDTMYHLHRALNAGRIDLERFLKTTRALAEEQFTKRALIERITLGLSRPDASASWQ